MVITPVERLRELGGIATRGTLLRTVDRGDLAARSRRVMSCAWREVGTRGSRRRSEQHTCIAPNWHPRTSSMV
jgi:hypothetical protein